LLILIAGNGLTVVDPHGSLIEEKENFSGIHRPTEIET
jgi:hypothetical protein